MAIKTELIRDVRKAIVALFSGGESFLPTEVRHDLVSELRRFASQDAVQINPNSALTEFVPSSPVLAMPEYVDWLKRVVLRLSANLQSPLCMGHMSGPVPEFVGIVTDFINRLNQNVVKRDASPAFTALEQDTIAMLHRLVFGETESFYRDHRDSREGTLGIVGGGGTIANLTALWIARNTCFHVSEFFAGVERTGTRASFDACGCNGAAILGSRLMHYSIEKSAAILGLGSDAVQTLPVDGQNRLDIDALKDCVSDCLARRRRIVAIIGVAGTTDCGSIDPLCQISTIASESGAWFHVDAAWGAPLIFSKTHQSKLNGINLADSITIDPHKQMYTPQGTGVLLLRNPQAASVIQRRCNYMLQDGSGDLGRRSLYGSRGGAAMFVHAALSIIGRQGYEFLVDQSIQNANVMAQLIRARKEFELLFDPATNIVLYRFVPERLRETNLLSAHNLYLNTLNEDVQKGQSAAGRTFVSRTTVQGTRYGVNVPIVAFRAVTSHSLLQECHIRRVLDDQASIGKALST